MIQISNVINSIAEILQMFLPGYIGITILSTIINHKFSEHTIFFSSISASVITSSLFMIVAQALQLDEWYRSWVSFGASILFLTLASIFAGFIMKTEKFSSFTEDKFHSNISDSVLQTVIGNGEKNMYHIYYKDGETEVIGQLKSYDPKGRDPWIALQNYICFNCKTGDILLDYSKADKTYTIIPFDVIKSITVEPMR